MKNVTLLLLLMLIGFGGLSAQETQEAEAETETESEVEAETEAKDGKGIAAIAIAVASASTGSFSLTASLTSGSVSRDDARNSQNCDLQDLSNSFTQQRADSLVANADEQAGEVEAEVEVEVESEAEVEVGIEVAAASGGSGVGVGVARTDIARPFRESISTGYDASTSTSAMFSDRNVGPGTFFETPSYDLPELRPDATNQFPSPLGGEKQEVEAEVEAETEAEAEAETLAGSAAAAATGGAGVGAAGTLTQTDALVSTATSVITQEVTQVTPQIFEGIFESQARRDYEEKMSDRKRKQRRIAFEKTEAESEVETEVEVEVEAEVNNQAAAAAAVTSVATGTAGKKALSISAGATSTSTSTENFDGLQRRNNDLRSEANNVFNVTNETYEEAEADAEAEAEAYASSRTNSAAAQSNTEAKGASVSEAQLRMTTFNAPILSDRAVDNFNVTQTIGRRQRTRGEEEVEVEAEAEAEAEAEVGFYSAAAGAGAGAGLGRNIPLTQTGAAASTSTSTSVGTRAENRQDDNMRVLNGRRDPDFTSQEAETETEAEAEVGIFAGAGAVSVAAGGYKNVRVAADIKVTPFAAAVAGAAGQRVTVTTVIPANNQAGMVRATALAEDDLGRGVAVAVAVAGVPTDEGEDVESEREQESDFSAYEEVEVFTDPARAPNLTIFDNGSTGMDDVDGADGSDTEIEDNDLLEVEIEAEAESEAEAGYLAAAAAAAASVGGPYATTLTISKTSTNPNDGNNLPLNTAIGNTPVNKLGEAGGQLKINRNDGQVVLKWEAPGKGTYRVEYTTDGGTYQSLGKVRGANPDGVDEFNFSTNDEGLSRSKILTFRVVEENNSEFKLLGSLAPTLRVLDWVSDPYPNPAKKQVEMVLRSETSQEITAVIVDAASGTTIATVFTGELTAGEASKIIWAPSEKTLSGTYYLRVTGDNINETKKIVLMK